MRNTARLAVSLSALALLGAACMSGGAGEGSDETWTLNYSSHVDANNYHSKAVQWWAEQVEERTDGRVTVDMFYNESLCGFVEHVACLSDGRIDLAIVSPLNHPSELPISGISTLPFESNNEEAFALTLGDFYEQNEQFKNEWQSQGTLPLVFGPVNLAYLGSPNPVEGLETLRGQKVRGAGYLQQAVDMAGMAPVSLSFGEIYESLERGVLDAWITSIDGAVSISLQEVTDYWVDLKTGNFTAIANPAMSKATFDSMPEDIQEVIREVSAELKTSYMEDFFLPGARSDCEAVMPEIESFVELPADDVERWEGLVGDSIGQEWVSAMEEAGVSDPDQLLTDFRELLAENENSTTDVSQVEICNSI